MTKLKDQARQYSVRRWTPSAIECYQRGCVCSGCFYKEFFGDGANKCRMKTSVLELVRLLGAPPKIDQSAKAILN